MLVNWRVFRVGVWVSWFRLWEIRIIETITWMFYWQISEVSCCVFDWRARVAWRKAIILDTNGVQMWVLHLTIFYKIFGDTMIPTMKVKHTFSRIVQPFRVGIDNRIVVIIVESKKKPIFDKLQTAQNKNLSECTSRLFVHLWEETILGNFVSASACTKYRVVGVHRSKTEKRSHFPPSSTSPKDYKLFHTCRRFWSSESVRSCFDFCNSNNWSLRFSRSPKKDTLVEI